MAILGLLLSVFGTFTLLSSLRQQTLTKQEKQTLIDVFYNQTEDEPADPEPVSNTVINSTDPVPPPKTYNNTIGILRVPAMKLAAPIGYGVSTTVLKKQVGMYTTTDKFLTVGGNTGFAAHTSFNGGCSYCFFYKIRDIKLGDTLYVDYKDKRTYTFEVIEILLNQPITADIAYTRKIEDAALITLSTCSTKGKTRDFVVAK